MSSSATITPSAATGNGGQQLNSGNGSTPLATTNGSNTNSRSQPSEQALHTASSVGGNVQHSNPIGSGAPSQGKTALSVSKQGTSSLPTSYPSHPSQTSNSDSKEKSEGHHVTTNGTPASGAASGSLAVKPVQAEIPVTNSPVVGSASTTAGAGTYADFWRSGMTLFSNAHNNPNVLTEPPSTSVLTTTTTTTTAIAPSSSSTILRRSSTGIATASAGPTAATAIASSSSSNATTGANGVSVKPAGRLMMKRTGGSFQSRAASFSAAAGLGKITGPPRVPDSAMSKSSSGLGITSRSAAPNPGASPVPSQPSRPSLANHPSIQALQGQWEKPAPKKIPGINAECEADSSGSANTESTSRPRGNSNVSLKRHAEPQVLPALKRHQVESVGSMPVSARKSRGRVPGGDASDAIRGLRSKAAKEAYDEEEYKDEGEEEYQSSDLDLSTDDEDWKNIQPKTAIPGNSDSLSVDPKPAFSAGDARIIMTKGKTRPYTHFYDETGSLVKQWGALFPTNYHAGIVGHGYRHQAPWICPIRSCRRQLANIKGLCGHFNAGHASEMLNDNLDGTFSVVGQNRTPLPDEKTKPAIVVSQNQGDPSEPIRAPSLPNTARSRTNEPKMPVPPLPLPNPPGSSGQRSNQHQLQHQPARSRNGGEDSGPGRPANLGKPGRPVRPLGKPSGVVSNNSTLNPGAAVPLPPSLASRIRGEGPPPLPATTRRSQSQEAFHAPILKAPHPGRLSIEEKHENRLQARKMMESFASSLGYVIPKSFYDDEQLDFLMCKTRFRNFQPDLTLSSPSGELTQDMVDGMILYLVGATRRQCVNCPADECFVFPPKMKPLSSQRLVASWCARCLMATPKQPCQPRYFSSTGETAEESAGDDSMVDAPDNDTMSMDDKADTQADAQAETVDGPLSDSVGISRAPTAMSEERTGGSELAANDSPASTTRNLRRRDNVDYRLGLRPRHHNPSAERAVVRAVRSSSNSPSVGVVISTGAQAVTDVAPMLEMEDWEVAPGRLRPTEDGDNIAFSNAFLTTNKSIPVAKDVSFKVHTLKPGQALTLEPSGNHLRLCSVATGKVKVATQGQDFSIGPGGMFKIATEMDCTVTNRLYIDSTLHVTSIDYQP